MNTKKWMMILSLLTLAAMLSACGGSKAPGKEAEKPSNQQQQTPENNNKTNDPDKKGTPDANGPSEGEKKADGEQKEVPDYLPKEFPIPEDVEISTAHAEKKGGKKYVLLIYSTHEDLAEVTKLYKQYFKADKFVITTRLTDEKNMIFQVDDTEQQHSWSLIGGLVDTDDGNKMTEITLTWEEM
ncbi:hypothetical protein [Paenibacillus sp. GCM10027626]|uniref:hypothetical protein n=1 Tax=Paenibacillus sp. GCM10027626 TaxID=3273411 RepID=UPI003629337D